MKDPDVLDDRYAQLYAAGVIDEATLEHFKQTTARLREGTCPLCGNDPDLSVMSSLERREYEISGICQPCQAQTFADPDTGEYVPGEVDDD